MFNDNENFLFQHHSQSMVLSSAKNSSKVKEQRAALMVISMIVAFLVKLSIIKIA